MYLRFMITLVNVSKIHDYISNAVAITLPAMFVFTVIQ